MHESPEPERAPSPGTDKPDRSNDPEETSRSARHRAPARESAAAGAGAGAGAGQRTRGWTAASNLTTILSLVFLFTVAVVLWVSRFDADNRLHWTLLALPFVVLPVITILGIALILLLEGMAKVGLRVPANTESAAGHWAAAVLSSLLFGYMLVIAVGTDISWDARWGRIGITAALIWLWATLTTSSITTRGMRRTLGQLVAFRNLGQVDQEADSDDGMIPILSMALSLVTEAAVFAAGAFAAITHALLQVTDTTLSDSSGTPTQASPTGLMGFYFWHLTNALPGDPLETLTVDAPYDYSETWVGALVLTYFAAVAIPLTNCVRELVRWHRAATVA